MVFGEAFFGFGGWVRDWMVFLFLSLPMGGLGMEGFHGYYFSLGKGEPWWGLGLRIYELLKVGFVFAFFCSSPSIYNFWFWEV